VLEPGQVVHGYRVERLVAAGAMGSVYQVAHEDRGTVHALKFLAVASQRHRQRLLREADLLVRLSHPNVVSLTELIDVDGDPALVLEWVEGPTLAAWLQGQRLPLAVAEALFVQIAAGVAHAHRRGIAHRDLKPSNVLLAETPAGLVPKVADFGVAKVFADDPSDPRLTETGASIGSPAYMAPEQVRDPRDVDARADVFALGCLLYELVTGVRAFPHRTAVEVMNAIVAGEHVPAEERVPELPARFRAAIEGALAVDRDARLPDVDALLDALTEGGGLTPVTSEPPRAHQPPRPGEAATWIGMGILAALALAAGAALAWASLR
jgi:serine/threonine-protein kinase